MAMLVASPLVLPRSDGGSASEHSGLSTHLSSARAEPRRDIFASAIAQAEQGQSISALARLTANPITFVEASDPQPSSLPISGKYEVLDDSKLPGFSTAQARSFIGPVIPSHLLGTDEDQLIASSTQTSSPKLTEDPAISTAVQKVLYTREIPSGWPQFSIRSPRSPCRGLDNVGNTCFLNSVLQCLLHTQGLLHIIIEHRLKDCPLHANGFCMMCQFSELAWTALYSEGNKLYVRPASILNSMGKIAKGLKRGRQEDAHEFLRLSIDAFQRAALAGTDPKLPHNVKETTWVHKLFGGRLRSRVTCQVCKHPSDTFDSLLDLSIDVRNQDSVRDALEAFTAIERLAGADKYKCEKCKQPVVAEKQFTIHDAPHVLTVHLKRFTPMGRKLTHAVKYGEHISLARYMSAGQFGPTYSLYGVISHAGSGPNQGHYYAHVKSSRGRWYEMNDELVSELRQPPLGIRNAYILFYVRQPGSALLSAIHQPMLPPLESPLTLSAPAEILSAKDRAEKRKRDQAVEGDEEEDVGVKTSPSTLGPSVNGVSSPGSKKTRFNENEADPAALSLRAKIMAVVSGTASGLDTGASGTSPSASKSDAARPNGAPIASECVRELPDADEKEMFGPSRSQTNDDPSTPPRPADDIPSVPLSEDVAPSSMPSLPSPSSRLPLELPSPSPNTTNNLDAIPPTSFYGTSTSGSNSNPKHQFSRVANENDRPYSKHRHYAPPHRHRRSGDIENDRHDGRHRGRHYSGANPYNALGGTFSSAGGGSSKLAGGGMRQRMKKRRPMM